MADLIELIRTRVQLKDTIMRQKAYLDKIANLAIDDAILYELELRADVLETFDDIQYKIEQHSVDSDNDSASHSLPNERQSLKTNILPLCRK